MSIQDINYSFVINSNNHNPTVVTDYFLLKSGIIDREERIDRKRFIVTPALTQVIIDNSIVLTVEPEKLTIQSSTPEVPFVIGQIYCENLVYIRATAIGYNFHSLVDNFKANDWINDSIRSNSYQQSTVQGIDYTYSLGQTVCTVYMRFVDGNKVVFTANFHENIDDLALGELNQDFLLKGRELYQHHRSFIDSILHSYAYTERTDQ